MSDGSAIHYFSLDFHETDQYLKLT